MCQQCADRMDEMGESPAAVEASWRCETCGEVKFKKEADPPEARGLWWFLDRMELGIVLVVGFIAAGFVGCAVVHK